MRNTHLSTYGSVHWSINDQHFGRLEPKFHAAKMMDVLVVASSETEERCVLVAEV